MRVIIPILLLAAASALAVAAQEGEKIYPFPYELVELENGFRAYLIQTPSPGQIAYITIVRTGSREEWEPGHSGFAHLMEHMMYRGTEKYPVYDTPLTEIGADNNAFTSDDFTAYYVVAAGDTLESVMDLESDRFKNLNYSEPAFKKETGAVLGEFYQGRANPFSFLFENLRATAFDAHTYKHTTIGFEDDVKAMPTMFDYSKSFYRRYYRPGNCVLLISGGFDVDKARELVNKYYSDWEPGYVPPEIETEPPQEGAREVEVKFPGRTLPLMSIAYKAPAWSTTDRTTVALQILGQIAFGQNSEIYKRLVVEERKVQFLSADFGLHRDPYLVTINTMVNNPADVDYVKSAIEETTVKFCNEPCDPQVLEDTKSAMKYGFLMGMQTPQGAAFSMLFFVVNTGGIEASEDYYKTVSEITVEDIQRAAREILIDDARTVATLTSGQEG